MVGRYTKSNNSFTLYIGDIRGEVRVFNAESLLIEQEFTLFGDKNDDGGFNIGGKRRKTRKLTQLLLLTEKIPGRNPIDYIVGVR